MNNPGQRGSALRSSISDNPLTLVSFRRQCFCATTPLARLVRAARPCIAAAAAAVLERARSGADIAGVVSFHGGLDTPNPGDAKNIKCKVLALAGGDDPLVPPAQVEAFEQEMRQAGVDWQLNIYGGAVHSFTNPASGNDPSRGAAYNEKADKRSWQAMRLFFDEIFGASAR